MPTSDDHYDIIVIGAGHNGLVAAATLARAGRRVLVLEARDVLGGSAATEEQFPGYRVDTGAVEMSLFQDDILQKLSVVRFGVEFYESPALLFAPQSDGQSLTLWRDELKTLSEIGRYSKHDAERYPAFRKQVEGLAGLLRGMLLLAPPDLDGIQGRDIASWGPLALRLRRMGAHEMMELFRVLPMAAQSFLDEWFESEALKGALGGSAVTGSLLGPRSAGTNLMLLYQSMGGLLNHRFVVGGMGRLSEALAAAARSAGADIRTGSPVDRVLLSGDPESTAVGVRLSSGEAFYATAVFSKADPRRTYFQLIGPQNFEPEVMRQVRNIIYRGSTARLVLALDGLPEFVGQNSMEQLGGRIRVSPSLDYLERAYDAAKYGRFSARPYLEMFLPTLQDSSLAPPGNHILIVTAQHAPYRLREGSWESCREGFADVIVDTLETVAPDIRSRILHRRLFTPADLEDEYSLTEGSIYHGQMGLDQLLVMRPIPGWSRYETPIRNLYLCGAGTHPGGGVTGAPGYNAAGHYLRNA